jgi:hypothetical protein
MLALLWDIGIAAIALNEEPEAFAIPGREGSLVKGECGAEQPQIALQVAGAPEPLIERHDEIAARIARGQVPAAAAAPARIEEPISSFAGLHALLAAMLHDGCAVLCDAPE